MIASSFGDKVINGLVPFQSLLYVDEKIDAVNHALDELHLWEAETVRVGDVESAPHGCRVNTAWIEKGKYEQVERLSLKFNEKYAIFLPVPRFCNLSLSRISPNLESWRTRKRSVLKTDSASFISAIYFLIKFLNVIFSLSTCKLCRGLIPRYN